MTTMTTTASQGTARALWRATLVGTVLQVAMVVGGHYFPVLKSLYAPGGMLISGLAGWLFGTARAADAGACRGRADCSRAPPAPSWGSSSRSTSATSPPRCSC